MVVHAVLLLGTSVPSILKSVAGKDDFEADARTSARTVAVREATESLRDIAEKHGLQTAGSQQPVRRRSRARPPRPPPAADAAPAAPEADAPAGTDEPKSAIEKELDVKADGPALPPIEDEQEDLFK